jgi:hypothetical protein
MITNNHCHRGLLNTEYNETEMESGVLSRS